MPYVGYLSCRPFYRGGDVVDAMALMGVAGSLTGASRLLVVWEHQDLCVALELPGAEEEPNGQVVVEAVLDRGHVLRWHPFRLHLGPPSPVGGPTVIPEWGAAGDAIRARSCRPRWRHCWRCGASRGSGPPRSAATRGPTSRRAGTGCGGRAGPASDRAAAAG